MGKTAAQGCSGLGQQRQVLQRAFDGQAGLWTVTGNARHNHALDPEELFVVSAFADEGPTLKRMRPRARGRASRILRRTSHVTIVVGDRREEGEEG